MSTKTTPPAEEVVEERPNDIEDALQNLLPYWKPIAAALALLIGVVFVSTILGNSQQAAKEAAWNTYIAASTNRDAEVLQEIANTSKGEVATLAQYSAAQAKLAEGSDELHKDRTKARAALNAAVEGFTKTLDQASGQPLIEQRTIMGLAQALEGLNDLGKAKTQYQQLIDKFPETPFAGIAKQRIESLNDSATKEFYDWFYAQNPADKLPAGGPINMPSMQLPGSPDFSVPDPNLLPPEADSDEPTSDATSDAADGAAAPADLPTTESASEPASE